jgi:response regulator RpfG family c-di-GMP phosphodiesterase
LEIKMSTSKSILFVDDDANALAGFQRALKGRFAVETAQGPQHGLQAVTTRGPYAVIVADMRMPVMNGVQFLQRVHEIAPDSVRVMLTGNADLQTAIDAVNDGCVFQFLCKPCPPAQLAKTLTAATAHYELICSERELLERTLRGSIKVLTEVLSLVNPLAFGRAMRIAETVRQLAAAVAPREAWQFELAALLSQLGCVTVSPAVLEAIDARTPLAPADRQRFDAHPLVARDLIAQIPRLGDVAEMIARQRESHTAGKSGAGAGTEAQMSPSDLIALGAGMLRLSLDFDDLIAAGVPTDEAIDRLRAAGTEYDPRLLVVLTQANQDAGVAVRKPARVALSALEIGMEVQEDVRTGTGLLLIAAGQTVTTALQQRVGNFLRLNAVFGTVRVLLPASYRSASYASSLNA